jgi:hypothetical protein
MIARLERVDVSTTGRVVGLLVLTQGCRFETLVSGHAISHWRRWISSARTLERGALICLAVGDRDHERWTATADGGGGIYLRRGPNQIVRVSAGTLSTFDKCLRRAERTRRIEQCFPHDASEDAEERETA